MGSQPGLDLACKRKKYVLVYTHISRPSKNNSNKNYFFIFQYFSFDTKILATKIFITFFLLSDFMFRQTDRRTDSICESAPVIHHLLALILSHVHAAVGSVARVITYICMLTIGARRLAALNSYSLHGCTQLATDKTFGTFRDNTNSEKGEHVQRGIYGIYFGRQFYGIYFRDKHGKLKLK